MTRPSHRKFSLFLLMSVAVLHSGFFWGKKEKLEPKQFVLAVEDFYRLAFKDIEQAFDMFASPACQQEISRIEKQLFPVSGADQGWSYFFPSSIYTTGAVKGDAALVMFYNPFCDAALLTLWELDGKGIIISDVDVFIGDFIRQAGGIPYDTDPRWLRKPNEPPMLGAIRSTNETIVAFEKMFNTADAKDQRNWRAKFQNLDDEQAMVINRMLAGTFFENVFIALEELFQDSANQPVRHHLTKILAHLSAGESEAVLNEAGATDPEVAKTISTLPTNFWRQVTAVAFLDSPGHSQVFFTPANNANVLGCFYFEKTDSAVRLHSIRMMDLKKAYVNRRIFAEKEVFEK